MAITKQFYKTKPECKVKFTLGAEEAGDAATAALLGDFNGWNPAANPMKKQKDGSFTITVVLPAGFSGQFRYCLDGERWLNDSAADGYAYSAFAAGDNFLLHL